MNFKIWLENQIVSFDFDDTLTKPFYDKENGTWSSNSEFSRDENIELMRDYASKGYKVIIVTSRLKNNIDEVENFVKKLGLPVSQIIATDGKNKGPILQNLSVQIHHDDEFRDYEDPNHEFKGKWIKINHPLD